MKRMPLVTTLLATMLLLPALVAAQRAPQPTNVRLTFHLIAADGARSADPEIEPVVAELRRLFRFDGYRLMTKSVLNATAIPSSTVQQALTDDQGRPFSIEAEVGIAGDDVRIRVQLYGPNSKLIDAAVNLQDGKTVVLGTANLQRPPSQTGQQTDPTRAIILAVTPTIATSSSR